MQFTEEAKSSQKGNMKLALGFKMELKVPKDFLMALPGLKTTFSILHFTDCFPPGSKDIYLNGVHLP